MTEQDLLSAVLEHYFSDWEVDGAKKVLDQKGMEAAVECLRKLAVNSCRGAAGPAMVSWQTQNGYVIMWIPGKSISAEPDYSIELRKFCRWKLESLNQARLL